MKLAILALLALFAIAASSIAMAAPDSLQEQRVRLIVEQVRRAVFPGEESRLTRYTQAIRIFWYERPESAGLDLFPYALLNELESLSGLPVSLTADAEMANLHIFAAPRQELAVRLRHRSDAAVVDLTMCSALVIETGAAISRSGAFADSQSAAPQRCVVRAIVDALSLLASACIDPRSILCPDGQEAAISDNDRILLRALYDPRVPVGATAAEAMPIIVQVVEDMVESEFETIVRQFQDTVFRDDSDDDLYPAFKWHRPLRVHVADASEGGDVEPYKPLLAETLRDIEEVTGLPATLSDNADIVNILLLFIERRFFKGAIYRYLGRDDPTIEMSEGALCAGVSVRHAGTHHLAHALVLIGSDNHEPDIRNCIAQELIQVVGPSADACHYRPSLFCEDEAVISMTPRDRLLLKALYDPRLVSGVRRDQAMPIVRDILHELYQDYLRAQLPPT